MQHLVWAWQHGDRFRLLRRILAFAIPMAIVAAILNALMTHWRYALVSLVVAFAANSDLEGQYWRDKATVLAVEVHALQRDLDQRDQRPRGVDLS
jgi:hypothetical protein